MDTSRIYTVHVVPLGTNNFLRYEALVDTGACLRDNAGCFVGTGAIAVRRLSPNTVDGCCAICLSDFAETLDACVQLPACRHVFHALCISKIDHQASPPRCPLCREPAMPCRSALVQIIDSATETYAVSVTSSQTMQHFVISVKGRNNLIDLMHFYDNNGIFDEAGNPTPPFAETTRTTLWRFANGEMNICGIATASSADTISSPLHLIHTPDEVK